MKEIDVRIDRRTELMSVLLYISNYRKEYPNLILFNKDIKYVKDVFDHFSKFQNHKAVKLLNQIVETLNFSYDAPFQLAWELKEDFSVGKLKSYPFKNRLNCSPIVEEFMKEIKTFAEDYPNDSPEPISFVKIARLGYKTKEVAVSMNERTGGVSSVTANIWRPIYYMINVCIAIVITSFIKKKR